MASRTPTPDGGARERLPNLFEVLSRRTLAPVDLYSFYIYMRDVQRSVDYLDFWYVSDDSFRASVAGKCGGTWGGRGGSRDNGKEGEGTSGWANVTDEQWLNSISQIHVGARYQSEDMG